MPSSNFPSDKISTLLENSDTVVLGLSGGPDSVYLLHRLLGCGLRLNIIACHVNFHLRGRESEADENFVQKLCRDSGVQLEILDSWPAKMPGNLEGNCRNLRYDFFEKVRQHHRAKYILTAHQQNDQVETFFLCLLRGSSLKGFTGMPVLDRPRKLLRPLLDVPKKEILRWLQSKGHGYRLDSSNDSSLFTRNRIRHEIIPVLESINPGFISTAAASLQDLAEHLEIVDRMGREWIKEHVRKAGRSCLQFNLAAFLTLPKNLRGVTIRQLYLQLNRQSLTRQTLGEILRTLDKNRAGLQKEFGKRFRLHIRKDPLSQKRAVVIEPKLL